MNIRRLVTVFTLTVLLVACNLTQATPTSVIPTKSPAPTTSPIPPTQVRATVAATVPPTIAPTETPLPHTTIDASTMAQKLLMGYQGWFSCPGDGSRVNGYFHWFKNNVPDAAHFRVDMWPAAGELTAGEQCHTSLKYPDGQPAPLYSAYNPKTVLRHFQWMSQYGIDGVFLQRFGSELRDPVIRDQRNTVLRNVRAGAEAYGRTFALMYATSQEVPSDKLIEIFESDWRYLVDVQKVTESPAYQRQNGKPVLAIWGFGFPENTGTPQQAMELLNYFENNPDPKYQVTLLGGVPTWWRTLKNDSSSDPAWAEYYCGLDIISPWTVGRFRNPAEADTYKAIMTQDMARANECGAQYMPVVYPGTSLHNDSGSPYNEIPRQGGKLYWRQVYNAVSLGVPMIYNAMFDEVDEGTAMYKVAATAAEQPAGVDLVSLDADGYKLPNDWYLQLAGAASQMLRGEIPLAREIPIDSGFEAPPTPVGTYRLRIQIATSSDWSTLTLTGGGVLADPELVSASAEAVNFGAQDNHFSLGQPVARANAGAKVEMVVTVSVSDLKAGTPLQFVIESGALGRTTVTLFNDLADPTVAVKTVVLNETKKIFEVPAEALTAP